MAEPPNGNANGKILQMQTAFNPNLPGAGEGVRTFTRSIRHMSGGNLVIKRVRVKDIVSTALVEN